MPGPSSQYTPPKIIQATPGGYLVDYGDGQPVLTPESAVVEAGLIPPTPGLNAQPAMQANMQQAAPQPSMPQAPQTPAPPASVPGPHASAGYSWRGATDQSGAPVRPDFTPQLEALAQSHGQEQAALGEQAKALRTQGDLEVQRQQAVAPLMAKIPADLQEQQNLTAQFDQTTREYVEKENMRIMQRVAAVPQEDPGKIWRDQPAWQNALGLLSAVTGGMLAVTTGSGRNMGLEAIERAIQRDVEAQRTNIDNEWKKIARDERGLEAYQQWKARDRQNMLEEGIMRREALKFAAEAEGGKYSSLSKQAEYAGLAAGFDAKTAEDQAELDQLNLAFAKGEADTQMKDWATKKELSIQSRSADASMLQARTAAGKANAQSQPVPVHTLPDGRRLVLDPAYAATMGEARIDDLRKDTVKYVKMTDAMQQHRALVQQAGREFAGPGSGRRWSTDALKKANDSLNRTAATIAYQLSGAQYSDEFLNKIKDWVGRTQGWTGADPLSSQTLYIDNMFSDMERDLGGRGVQLEGTQRAGDPGTPAIAGPTPGGQAVLPKGTPVGQTRSQLNPRELFSAGEPAGKDTRPLAQQITSLGATVTASDNPDEVARALFGLANSTEADLAATVPVVAQSLSRDGDPGTAIAVMRAAATRAAQRAAFGDKPNEALANEILDAADKLESRLRGEEDTFQDPNLPAIRNFGGFQ